MQALLYARSETWGLGRAGASTDCVSPPSRHRSELIIICSMCFMKLFHLEIFSIFNELYLQNYLEFDKILETTHGAALKRPKNSPPLPPDYLTAQFESGG